MEATYRDVIKPIPPIINLSNVESQQGSPPCPACGMLLPDRQRANNGLIKTDYERVDTYPDFPTLKNSAKQGCEMCRFLRKSIRATWAIRPMEEWGVGALSEKEGLWNELFQVHWDRQVKIQNGRFTMPSFASSVQDGGDTSSVKSGGMLTNLALDFGPATIGKDSKGEELHGNISQILNFRVYDSLDLKLGNNGLQRRLPSSDTLSDTNTELMKRWVDDCIESHQTCRSSLSGALWLPRRLIHISRSNGSLSLQLVDTGDFNDTKIYAALSHMWGDITTSPPLRVIRFNYRAMIDKIALDDLPRNFIDAIRVCEKLEIRYLWIDSLCIVQDDPDDWARESVTMHLVYRHAVCTIVATSATSCHDGFLTRDTRMTPAVKVKYDPLNANEASQDFLILSLQDDAEIGSRHGDVDASSWNGRGWTMQERSLSTRLIYFCSNNLYFECRECLKSESNDPEIFQTYNSSKLWPRMVELDSKQLFSQWRNAVIEYSHRQLTRAYDKLPAIQSIANEMGSKVLGEYLAFAGVWERDIRIQLHWYVERGNRVRLPKYRAPTWSWASLEVRISFQMGSVSEQELRKTSLDIYHDAFKLIAFGEAYRSHSTLKNYIELTGWTKSIAHITSIDHSDYWLSMDRFGFPYDLFGKAARSSGEVRFAHGRLDLDNWDNFLSETQDLLYLHVLDDQQPSGLILQRAVDVQRPDGIEVWRRVGVATIFYGPESEAIGTTFEERCVMII